MASFMIQRSRVSEPNWRTVYPATIAVVEARTIKR